MQKIKQFIAALLFLILLACGCADGDTDIHSNVFSLFIDDSFFVKQGSGQCGPTSFYMIFKYYGDNEYTGTFGELPGCAQHLNLQEDLITVTEDSGVSTWLGVTGSGIAIEDLFEKISNLGDSACEPYYEVDGNTDDSLGANSEEFDYIADNFLSREYPVIIHLDRKNQLYSGHYIVMAGYDAGSQMVYFVDPNRNDEDPVVQSVQLSSFLNDEWYRSPDYDPVWYPVPDAYWDGTWVGFYPRN